MKILKRVYPVLSFVDVHRDVLAIDDWLAEPPEPGNRMQILAVETRMDFITGDGEITIVVSYEGDGDPGIWPWTSDMSGADRPGDEIGNWTEVPQACGGGDPT